MSATNGAQKPVKRSRFDMKEPVVNIKTENMAETVPVSQPPSSTMPPLNPDQISQMMENVRKQIEERKRKLNINVETVRPVKQIKVEDPPSPPPPSQNVVIPSELDSKARLAALTAQIQARLASRPNLAHLMSVGEDDDKSKIGKPTPLILNAEGRTVDVSGKEVQLIQRMPTLKANIRAQKKEQFVKLTTDKSLFGASGSSEQDTSFLDSRIGAKAAVRPKRGFKFHEKGTFESIGQKLRTQAQLDLLQKEIALKAKKTGISSAARLALLSSIVPTKESRDEEVPEVEWWDTYIMKDSSYEACMENPLKDNQKYDGITHLIEHPVKLKASHESAKPVLLPVFLTKKEQKKLRRQNRREAWKEKQEKIRMGLEPAPEPKLKMSNMMRVLGQQAVQDPTKIEAHVREQMMRRQKAHEEANEARKLTGEQKKQKKTKKIKEDTSGGVHVSVYRLLSLQNPAKKFKVDANIKQLLMTGVVVLYKNINVVVVEGGMKQQKKFRRLMLNRIKWNEDQAFAEKDDPVEGDKKVENKCLLVWEGLVKSRAFGEVKFKISPNESFAREIFKNHGVEHYWDLAYSISILDSADS